MYRARCTNPSGQQVCLKDRRGRCTLGGQEGPRGGAVVLNLALNTRSCAGPRSNSALAKHWSSFWSNKLRDRPGCRVQCVYRIIMSVTQRVVPDPTIPLVSGYAVVGDAKAVVGDAKATADQCDGTDFTSECQEMMWVPDSLIRDSLAEIRFNIASDVLGRSK